MQDDILKTQQFDAGERATLSNDIPQLVTLEGTQVGKSYPLTGAETRIGRLESNDLVLRSNPVSKRHACVIQEQGLFFIEDLGSTNGVVVNGQKLTADMRKRLFHGDNIRLSDHLFMFRQESSFVDGTGTCCIKLDQEKIDAEVQEVLDDWFTELA